jgi:GTP-binding protein
MIAQTYCASSAARGGKGNPHFTSNDIRGPPFALRGELGNEILLEFELKSLADAGISSFSNI